MSAFCAGAAVVVALVLTIPGRQAGAGGHAGGRAPGLGRAAGLGAGRAIGRPPSSGARAGVVWQVQWQEPQQPPVEESLSVGTLGFLRSVRRGLRRIGKTVAAAGGQWADWGLRGLAFLVLIVLAPLLDVALVRTWRRDGLGAARRAAMLAVAVNLRLLVDRKVPAVARLPLVFAVVYGVAVRDMMPDGAVAFGRIDDVIVTLVAARLFTALCPDGRVAAHARRVAARTAVRLPRPTGTGVNRGLAGL